MSHEKNRSFITTLRFRPNHKVIWQEPWLLPSYSGSRVLYPGVPLLKNDADIIDPYLS